MSMLVRCCLLLAISFSVNADERRIAAAVLTPRAILEGTGSITGSVVFTEEDDGLRIIGHVIGLPGGQKYGFHVHELGNILTCDSSGAHFNPESTNHGGQNHEVRHVGDLGNIEFTDYGANINITDHIMTLRGRNNIVGRTLVLHAQEDDLGLGGHADSLTTGNAGARVACGVIGIVSPSEPWNSAVTSSPSLLLFIAAAFIAYFRC